MLKKTVSLAVLLLLSFSTLGSNFYLYAVAPTGSIELTLDKSSANVGDIIKATLSIQDIQNFSGYQVCINYDPSVLLPVHSDESEYETSSVPDVGTLLQMKYSSVSMGDNDLTYGSLVFGKLYMGLASYRASQKPETSGSLAEIYFKVLKKSPTNLRLENLPVLEKGIEGTVLFDWYGNQITGYSVIQAPQVNVLPIIGNLEKPINDQNISTNTYSIYGWLLDPSGVSRIEVLVDGNILGTVDYGYQRPDVLNVFPEYSNLNCGYRYNLNTSALSAGQHVIRLRETSNTGSVKLVAEKRFIIRKIAANLESPSKSTSQISGNYNITGWFGDTIGVSKISIFIDGIFVGDAVYGISRPDVQKVYPYFTSNTGFRFMLDTSKLSNGTHTITIIETAANGESINLSPRTFTILN